MSKLDGKLKRIEDIIIEPIMPHAGDVLEVVYSHKYGAWTEEKIATQKWSGEIADVIHKPIIHEALKQDIFDAYLNPIEEIGRN